VERKAVVANLERYRSERRRVQGLVVGFNRGGFDVLVEGARAFCPASAMSLEEIEDPTEYLGQKLEFLLPASQAVTKDIIVSRRSILERLQRKKARELVRSLEPGQRIKGRVTQVREFGVFVDIGGIEGLVHQSELSFAHGAKPADVAQVGEEIEVQVLRVGAEPNKRDTGKRDRVARVSLSVKALLPDPWDAHAATLKEGTAQTGKVTRTTDFGAFIEIAPQIEGLLHITELGRDLKHASQAVQEGDELQVVIERVDRRARRISLSKLSAQEAEELQAVGADEAAQQSVRPGARIKVKVARVEPRGLVVRVAGVLGRRARGYVPGSELAGGRGGDLRKLYPVGSELEVKVVGVDRDGGLRCSPKALAVDEERRAVKDYRREAAKQGFGTFGDLLRAKLGGQADPE
jgi:small subunit ribosomal protein S1